MLDFFTVVWGEMIETFLEFSLPSLLQEGNIPAIRQLCNYNFYASDEAREIITQNERFHELEKLIPISWEPLQKGEWECTSNMKHQMAKSAACQHYMLLSGPDLAFGNWSLFNLANLTDGTRNPVQYGFPRINEQGYHALRQIFRQGKSISNRQLVSFAMKYIRKEINYPIRQVDKNKWIVGHSGLFPCILPDEKVIEMFAPNNTPNDLTHVLSYMMIEAGYPFYVIPHSDTCFMVERGKHIILKHPGTEVRWRPDEAAKAFRFYGSLEQTWQGEEIVIAKTSGEAVSLPTSQIKLIKVQGHQMYVDLDDYGHTTQDLVDYGIYHKQMTSVVKSIMRRGMVFVDVGANIGYFTLLAARIVGKEGRVFAFEPEPHNFELLVRNIAINGYQNITPVQKAISNRNGTAELFIRKHGHGAHSLGVRFHDGTVVVATETLDSFFEAYQGKIDLIKIDVEGWEMAVLQGMKRIVSENKSLAIITEFNPILLQWSGQSPVEYLNSLVECGFNHFYDINEEQESTDPITVLEIMKKYPWDKGRNLLVKREEG